MRRKKIVVFLMVFSIAFLLVPASIVAASINSSANAASITSSTNTASNSDEALLSSFLGIAGVNMSSFTISSCNESTFQMPNSPHYITAITAEVTDGNTQLNVLMNLVDGKFWSWSLSGNLSSGSLNTNENLIRAENCLESYQAISNASYCSELDGLLSTAVQTQKASAINGDFALNISADTQGDTTLLYSQIVDGCTLQGNCFAITMSSDGLLTSLVDNMIYYVATTNVNVTEGEAIALATPYAAGYASQQGQTITATNVTFGFLRDVNGVRGDNFAIYPAWTVSFTFDQINNESVYGYTVELWADNGQVFSNTTQGICYESNSMCLGCIDGVPSNEVSEQTLLTSEITSLCSSAGMTTENWFGSSTTESNIYLAAEGDGYTGTMVFYIGHGTYTQMEYNGQYFDQYGISYDNDFTAYTVYDYQIYPYTNGVNGEYVNFVLLWSCDQGNTIGGYEGGGGMTYGMPLAWLNTIMLSGNGYTNPDTTGKCFIGWNGGAPYLTATAGNVSDGCYDFLYDFYYFAATYGASYTVNQALNMAADLTFGSSSFATCCLYTGIGIGVSGAGNMVVYGDGSISLGEASHSGGGCVLSNTRITMADGRTLPVQLVKPGDEIMGYNVQNGTFVTEKVTSNNQTIVHSILSINNGLLSVTLTEQPIFTDHGWITNPQDLQVGWQIYDPTQNSWITIHSIEQQNGTFAVYDLRATQPNVFIGNGLLLDMKAP